ncbi:MAG: restriction endonuclease [Methylocystis sp.]
MKRSAPRGQKCLRRYAIAQRLRAYDTKKKEIRILFIFKKGIPWAGKSKQKDEGAQFVRYFGPVLDALRRLGDSGTPDEVVERIAIDLSIPDKVQNELLPSGEPRFRNQVHWARFYLVKEGLLDSSKRGVWSLTEKGRATHLSYEQAHAIFLKWVRIFQEQRRAKAVSAEPSVEQAVEAGGASPDDYRTDAIELILSLSPAGFEKLSQRILREAGFVQVVVTGRSGDEGIDGYGTLQINALVSFKVLFQCKRYRKSVSPSHVRDFRGAMAGRADKGIIITTGTFTAEARREASRDGVPPIELIDGEKLVEMLEQLELGLKPKKTYEIDELFFKEFD